MKNEIICQNCKTILPPGSIYCHRCGTRINEMDISQNKTIPIVQPTESVYLAGGTVLQGKYRINHVIGRGGFGITYDGTDLKLQMHIAIKEFFPNQIADRSATVSNQVTCTSSTQSLYEHGMQNFLTEAKNMAKFAGQPCFVSVHDYFIENNTAYIIMEYVEGQNLKSYIQRQGRLPMGTAMAIIWPVMDALETIHGEGMIHRDISPTNIMVLPDGRIKLLDFGAVKDLSRETQTLTTMSAVYKKGYSPIEQQTTDMRQGTFSDIYALCATLYEMLTGTIPPSPFSRLSGTEVLIPPSSMGVQILPSQEAAILKGLEVYPQDRIQTVSELRAGLSSKTRSRESGVFTNPSKGQKNSGDRKKTMMLAVLICAAAVILFILSFELAKAFRKNSQDSIAQSTDNTDGIVQDVTQKDTGEEIESSGEEGPAGTETVTDSLTNPVTDKEESDNAAVNSYPEEEETSREEDEETIQTEEAVIYDYPGDALSYGGHHYYIYDETASDWDEALQQCIDQGGYLAVINDADENEAVYQYMVEMGFDSAYFGLLLENGSWQYITGDTSDFRDWGYNSKNIAEPNNSGEKDEIHAEFDVHMHDGHWNDSIFGKQSYTPDGHHYINRFAYICEWDG